MIATIEDDERGPVRRGFVPERDFLEGNEWAVDSSWEDHPPEVIQVAVIPMPRDLPE